MHLSRYQNDTGYHIYIHPFVSNKDSTKKEKYHGKIAIGKHRNVLMRVSKEIDNGKWRLLLLLLLLLL